MRLPVFDDEGFDAIDFSLLVSLLLRTQNLLGVRLHVPLGDQHFVRHRKLPRRENEAGTSRRENNLHCLLGRWTKRSAEKENKSGNIQTSIRKSSELNQTQSSRIKLGHWEMLSATVLHVYF